MAQCPNCSAPIADDFGLIECPACNAQLLVHVDGRVEYSGSAAEASAPDAVADANEPTAEEVAGLGAGFEDDAFEDVPYENSAEFSDDDAAEPDDMFAEDVPAGEEPVEYSDAPADEASEYSEESVEAEPVDLGEYPDFDEPEPPPPGAPVFVAPNDSPDLSDIARFGNSDVTSAREGSLRYNVRVTGIDTVDVRDAFREALTDRKFVWDTDHILRSIKNGECTLKDVTATKAHVLISRLRTLPIEVEWEQYAISQA